MSSRTRPSSARPQAAKRASVSSSSNHRDHDLVYECKAAYLVVADDIDDPLTSSKQLMHALQSAGRNPTRKMIKQYWPDEDEVTFDQFVDICRKEQPTTEDELMKAFRKIDLNGDGYISNRELRKTLTSRGDKMTVEEVQAIIDEVDENQDGKLDYGEFCKMVLGTQDESRKVAVQQMEKKQQRKKTSSSKDTLSPRSGRQANSDDFLSDMGSQHTLTSRHGDSISVSSKTGSQTSLKSVCKLEEGDLGKLSARSSRDSKDYVRPAVASRDLKLHQPKRLKEWTLSHSKGCFFFDDEDDSVVSHHYSLRLSRDSSVFITIQPYTLRQSGSVSSAREVGSAPVDTMLFILRDDGSLVTVTEQRDIQGKYGVRCDLEKGRYKLIPFTTGCRLHRRLHEPSSETKLVKKKEDKYVITKPFRDALSDIFDLCDLDGNGYLSREEFNFFNLRTSAEGVMDSEWEVVEDTVGLKDGEISREAFISLNQLEAEDNQGDTEDLWVTLSCMGFNKNLVVDEACPFNLDVYTESCEGRLKVDSLSASVKEVQDALIEVTMGKGESSKVKQMRDLYLHTYLTDSLATLVLENKSHHKVTVEVDCHRSKNCVSSLQKLDHQLTVAPKSSVVALHLMPVKETKEWVISCAENVK